MSGWVNYPDIVRQLQDAGLILDRDLNPGGAWQTWRVEGEDRERRGRSILREWTSAAGNCYLVGLCGVWHGNSFGRIKLELPRRDDAPERRLSAADQAAMAAARKAVVAEAERIGKAQAKRAAGWAAAVWAQCVPAREHDYLTRKGIQPHTARILASLGGLALPDLDEANADRLSRAEGALVIPLTDVYGTVQGLQFIAGTAKHFWPTSMALASHFGLIGSFPRRGILLLTEGYATAASLHEATGYPVVYAFSANNLAKVARELAKARAGLRVLACADDDYLTKGNPGRTAAIQAANAMDGRGGWCCPDFTGPDGQDLRAGRKLTDFNDLLALTGSPLALAAQVHAKLDALGWRERAGPVLPAGDLPQGGGDGARALMPSLISIDDAAGRFWNTYGLGGKVLFDEVERRLVHRDDALNILPPRAWDQLKSHPGWRTARDTEVGFDPTEQDPAIRCNLFGGWPTVPVEGCCDALLGLLEYLCSNEPNGQDIYRWMLRWLAYPLQRRGAKMHTAPVFHGPQGTGKSRFFEAYGQIFGDYFRVLGQEAIEDKFNADWAEKKLFVLADEVLARQDMYHVKNRLKGFITSDSIRVNPKNVAAHTERNHMNMVFLSNERMPLIIEADDRRHIVVWVPPKLSPEYFSEVNEEIAQGGVAALHHYLLNLDLGDFRPWTPPPDTQAKRDLQGLGASSETRFVDEWLALDLEGPDGGVIPVCPCLGSHLYRVYEAWCERHGERKRGAKDLISCVGKRHGWRAGDSAATWATFDDRSLKKRKMVIPSPAALAEALKRAGGSGHGRGRQVIPQPEGASLAEWLTDGYFSFAMAAGIEP